MRWSAPGESKRGPRQRRSALGDLAQLDADDRERLAANQRRLTPKGRATRDRIVAVAAQLMFEHGVGSTSLADVQEAAGVGASQVYHYFGDKQSLVKAVIAYNTDAVPGTVRPRLGWTAWTHCELGGTCLSKTQRDRHCEGGCPLGSLVAELAENYPECRTRRGIRPMGGGGPRRSPVDARPGGSPAQGRPRSFGCSPSGCGSRRHPACAAAPRPISP
jgi:AcrR family transcriptional regulator